MWKRRGVNYIDVYQRTGNLEIPKPFTPGYEGVGRVREIGPGVANFKPGTRVAWINNFGPYAEEIILPATTEQGAAVSGRHCPHCPILTDRVQIDPVSSIRITLSGRRPDSALCVPGMRRCDVRKAPHLGRPAELDGTLERRDSLGDGAPAEGDEAQGPVGHDKAAGMIDLAVDPDGFLTVCHRFHELA